MRLRGRTRGRLRASSRGTLSVPDRRSPDARAHLTPDFEPTRVPRKIDEEPLQDPPREGPGRVWSSPGTPRLPELDSGSKVEISARVRPIGIEKASLVASRCPGLRWLLEVFHQSGALFRKRYGYLGKGCAARYWWQAVLSASPHTAHGESPLLHEAFQPELEGSMRESGRQTAGYLPGRESPLLAANRILDRAQVLFRKSI